MHNDPPELSGHNTPLLEVQLAFHKEQVCTCGQIEVQLSQQHGRL